MKLNDALIFEIDELVVIAEKLSRDASRSDSNLGPERIEELSAVASRGGQLIRRLYGQDSQYKHNLQKILDRPYFTSMHSNDFKHISELTGILKGVQHDIKSGLLSDLRRLLNAEIFADFLDMSEHLLNEGYKDAAAVILGAVIEDSLRKLADGNGVSTTTANGKNLTIDPLNVALAKKGVYGPLVQKQITTWANLRNDAAHAHFEKYDADQVKQMLLFVQKFCADYLQ
ncbi:MAG: hypothetical protein HYV59_05575 [Planctomycetes bacterium]|nr:hypothetical protein [Planctomycetota bacterium]